MSTVVIKTTITLNKALTGLNSQIYFTPIDLECLRKKIL